MTNLLTPLKKLGKKLTGKDIAGTNLVTVVDDIANKYDGSGGGGGGGGDNGNVVLKLSEATVLIEDWSWSFAPITFKDVFDALESGNNVVVVDDDEPGDVQVWNAAKSDASYSWHEIAGEVNAYINISFGSYFINYKGPENYSTLDEWLSQPFVINLGD